MARLRPFFPKSHGEPRVNYRKVLSGIIFINRNGLRWRDAPIDYGPHKTLYNGWKRWPDKGIFSRILVELAKAGDDTDTLAIDATHLNAHRTAASLGLKKGGADRLIGLTKGGRNTNCTRSWIIWGGRYGRC